MALTFVKSAGTRTAGSGTTITVQLTTVTAGHLIVIFAGAAAVTSTTVSVSDGTTAFTLTPQGVQANAGNACFGSFHYLLSSVASGTVTYTATFGAAKTNGVIYAFEYSYTGTPAFDVENVASSNGGTTALTTGNVTTTGSDEVLLVGVVSNTFGGAITSPTIDGTAGTHATQEAGPLSEVYDLAKTGVTVGGGGTMWNSSWVALIASFKATAAGGGVTYPQPLTLLGVQ